MNRRSHRTLSPLSSGLLRAETGCGRADPCFRLDFREGAAALGSRAPAGPRSELGTGCLVSGTGSAPASPPRLCSGAGGSPGHFTCLPGGSVHPHSRNQQGCPPDLAFPTYSLAVGRDGTGRDGAARGAGSRQALPAARPATSHQPPARGEEQQGAPSPSRGHVPSSACGMRAAPGRPPERLAGYAWSALSPAAQTVPPGAAATPSPPAPTRPSPESESESAACGPAPGGPCEPTCGSGSCPCARTPT